MSRARRRRRPATGRRLPQSSDADPRNGSPNGRAPASPLLARNVEAVAQLEAADRARQTAAERFSDAVAQMAGTTWFVGFHVVWFAAWIAWNTGLVPGWRPIDPFPFSFLTLVVSLEAIFLTLFVLISQNNLTRQSERRAHLDLQVNLLAEQESTKTVALLERIARQLHVPLPADCESELAAPTDIQEVVSTLDSVLPGGLMRSRPKGSTPMTSNGPRGSEPPRPVEPEFRVRRSRLRRDLPRKLDRSMATRSTGAGTRPRRSKCTMGA